MRKPCTRKPESVGLQAICIILTYSQADRFRNERRITLTDIGDEGEYKRKGPLIARIWIRAADFMSSSSWIRYGLSSKWSPLLTDSLATSPRSGAAAR